MRWPWSRPEPPPVSSDVDEAVEARQQAEEQLEQTQEMTAEVREIAKKLREHRHVNHFAELFGRSLGGHG